MFQNENLNTGSCIKPKEMTVVDNIRDTREILMKTSDCLERLKMFLKLSPEEDCCKRPDTIRDLYNDVVDLRAVAAENLSKVYAIMNIIGLEGRQA